MSFVRNHNDCAQIVQLHIAGAVIGVSQDIARRIGELDQPAQEIVLAADGDRRAGNGFRGTNNASVVVIRVVDRSDRIYGHADAAQSIVG